MHVFSIHCSLQVCEWCARTEFRFVRRLASISNFHIRLLALQTSFFFYFLYTGPWEMAIHWHQLSHACSWRQKCVHFQHSRRPLAATDIKSNRNEKPCATLARISRQKKNFTIFFFILHILYLMNVQFKLLVFYVFEQFSPFLFILRRRRRIVCSRSLFLHECMNTLHSVDDGAGNALPPSLRARLIKFNIFFCSFILCLNSSCFSAIFFFFFLHSVRSQSTQPLKLWTHCVWRRCRWCW